MHTILDAITKAAPYVGYTVIAVVALMIALAGIWTLLVLFYRHRPHLEFGRPPNNLELKAWAETSDQKRRYFHTLPIRRWYALSYRHSWMIGFIGFEKQKP